ncbi:unnamed protein product [Dracunculus medinensis]|uniref:Clc-like protein n=1 Tax=Dracunculus medinensis TaxID=318479 RepID=A0A0N4UH64_DRAME|nr:unnamed protein product [Dracunculus medinensis]
MKGCRRQKDITNSASVDNDASTFLSEPFLRENQKTRLNGYIYLHRVAIALAIIFTTIGISLSSAAILLPSWQIVHLFEYNSVHEHGLWLDCTRNSRGELSTMRRHHTETEPLFCVYKWDYDENVGTIGDEYHDSSPIGEVNRHKLYGWQATTLILLGIALLSALLSICVGFCSCRYHFLSLFFVATTLLSTFFSTIAECIFFFYSHRADNRFINGIVGTYEQRVGLAFFLQLASCIAHLVAFLITLLGAFASLSNKNVRNNSLNMSQISKSATSFLPRSAQLDSSLVYQPTTAPDIIKSSPYHINYQNSYMKLPTTSLPDLNSTKLRSGSETCV